MSSAVVEVHLKECVVTTDPRPATRTATFAARHPDEGFVLTGPATPVQVLVRELWHSRALLVILARKDFYVRYRRTVLGIVWAVGVPVVQAVVLAVVFSHVLHFGRLAAGAHVSYPVFLYSGLVPWTYFVSVVPAASTAIVDNVGLASKIYFPRALTVGLPVLSGLYPLGISIALLLVLTAALGPGVGVHFLLVIPASALVLLVVACIGLCLSAAHVYFRDIRYIVAAALSVGFYVTPVLYAPKNAPGALRALVTINPAAGPVQLFRAATVGSDSSLVPAVLACLAWCVVFGGIGLWLQSRRDRVFVDLL